VDGPALQRCREGLNLLDKGMGIDKIVNSIGVPAPPQNLLMALMR
jgi:hypothetical protein